jgi:hypothetical protein
MTEDCSKNERVAVVRDCSMGLVAWYYSSRPVARYYSVGWTLIGWVDLWIQVMHQWIYHR